MKTTQTLKSAKGLALALILVAGFMAFSQTAVLSAPKAEVKANLAAAALINVNKASAEELQVIRGIGPSLAERIIQYREEHGRFEKAEDLVKVRGIGEAKFEKIKEQISL